MANEAKILAIKADLLRRAREMLSDDSGREDSYHRGDIWRVRRKS